MSETTTIRRLNLGASGYSRQVTHFDETAREPEIDDEAPVGDALEQRTAAKGERAPQPDRMFGREVSDVDAADQAIPAGFDDDDATVTSEEWDER